MNAKQRATWEELVRQCESRRSYSSINVASKVRSDAIVAAGELVELVTPGLMALLERLASHTRADIDKSISLSALVDLEYKDAKDACTLAAHIREALALEANDA